MRIGGCLQTVIFHIKVTYSPEPKPCQSMLPAGLAVDPMSFSTNRPTLGQSCDNALRKNVDHAK